MKCLNLCEIMNKSFFNCGKVMKIGRLIKEYERIYFGSYFCSNYFIYLDCAEEFWTICKKGNYKCTLVIPVFSQKTLDIGKKKIEEFVSLCQGYIDEITVNDVGMLCYVYETYPNIKINIGRLFFKDPRDPRIVNMQGLCYEPSVLENVMKDFKKERINIYEIDEVSNEIVTDNSLDFGIHYPYCFLTCGFICKYAAIHKALEKKFRPNSICLKECMEMFEMYKGDNEPGSPLYYRIGRAVFFRKDTRAKVSPQPKRMIYFPLGEIMNEIDSLDRVKCNNENFSSIK